MRQLRRAKGWTLEDLSRATQIPVSSLGKLETNGLSMPVDRLFRLSDALQVPVTEFFDTRQLSADDAGGGRRSVTRAGEGFRTVGPTYECVWLFTELARKLLFPGLQSLRARSLEDFGPLLRHEGEEFALVLKGTVTVMSDVYEPLVLHAMDGIYIDSRMGHAYLNTGNGEALILTVSTDARGRELIQGHAAPRKKLRRAARRSQKTHAR